MLFYQTNRGQNASSWWVTPLGTEKKTQPVASVKSTSHLFYSFLCHDLCLIGGGLIFDVVRNRANRFFFITLVENFEKSKQNILVLHLHNLHKIFLYWGFMVSYNCKGKDPLLPFFHAFFTKGTILLGLPYEACSLGNVCVPVSEWVPAEFHV